MTFSHIDAKGKATMVDVTDKRESVRTAEATAIVSVGEAVFNAIMNDAVPKGDVFSVSRIAGIQAGKKTSELIPLCHNIFLSKIDIRFEPNEHDHSIVIHAFVTTTSVTGVEMEALTSVSVAALTIYDMCKGANKAITIKDIHLVSKTGGKSGDFSFRGGE